MGINNLILQCGLDEQTYLGIGAILGIIIGFLIRSLLQKYKENKNG